MGSGPLPSSDVHQFSSIGIIQTVSCKQCLMCKIEFNDYSVVFTEYFGLVWNFIGCDKKM